MRFVGPRACVELGWASPRASRKLFQRSWIRSQVATTTYHLASPGKCHETISLCHGAPHATRPHQQRQRTHAREEPRTRARSTLLADASRLLQVQSACAQVLTRQWVERREATAHGRKKGSDRPPPPTRDHGSETGSDRPWSKEGKRPPTGRKKGSDRPLRPGTSDLNEVEFVLMNV